MKKILKRQGKVIVVQPVVPAYRKDFFDELQNILGQRLEVHASDIDMGVLTAQEGRESWRRFLGSMSFQVFGMEWQEGALSIPIDRNDVVVISGAPRCVSNILLLLRARLVGARTIWWGQLWSSTTRWYRFFLRLFLMRLAHAVLFYTDNELLLYKTRYGRWDKRPLGALNNGIDVKPISKYRCVYQAADRAQEILFIGRLTEKAQIRLLLSAMLEKSLTNFTLHVVGDGPGRPALQHWVECNGLNGRVCWHGGTVDEREISKVANRASVFCYPGSVGLSLLHAMAYGLPAVLHGESAKHMPEFAAFENGVTGVTFKKDNVSSLANALADLLADPVRRNRMSEASLFRSSYVYNTKIMADRFVEMVKLIEVSSDF